MKKLILTLMAVALIAVALIPNVAVAEDADETARSDLYLFVEELCDLQKTGKEDVREFLKDKFNEALAGNGAVEEQPFPSNYVNLVAKLSKTGSDKQIVIGAHYDSKGEGAGDNACGVAALYMTIKALADKIDVLPCNVVFVAFDGEEDVLLGSKYFVNNMSQAAIDSTLVMFNFDTIATGDNLYLQCENKSTDLAKLILANSTGIVEKPYAVGTYGYAFDVHGYGFYEVSQNSDHTPFRLKGIPIAFFFSGTYSSTFWNYAENSDASKSVMNTDRDTFENLTKNHPKFEERIQAVSQAVVATVTSESFLTVGQNARSQLVNLKFWYTVWWPIIAVAVIAVILIVAAALYYRKLQKKAILGKSEVKNQTVFHKPDAEEIFSFKTDDTDNIFTFKK